MVKEMPSSTVVNRDEECLRKSLMEVVKSDSSSICRLCLSKEQTLTRVFVDESGIDDALLKKIFDCTSVKVKLKDIFPSAICAVCDLKLNDFYKFREKCIENNTILYNLLGEDASKDGCRSVDEKTQLEKDDVEEQDGDEDEDDDDDEDGNGDGKEQEQQPATSTTTISEGQQNEATVAIALNQLSELGLRSMQDLADVKDEGSGMAGMIRVAKDLLSVPSSGRGHIVSSSWGAAQQELLEAHTQLNSKRAYVLASMDIPTGATSRAGREGKYECKECRRTFRNAYTLRRHNNLHTRTNLFPCEYCGKKFNDRSNWKIHQRSHTGDNLYTCLVCMKTFISPSTLKYHLRSHRRLESFDCRMCHDTFGSYELLEQHDRHHHQQGCMSMDDFPTDGDQMIDAARFVKIELEDGELSSSIGDISTTTNGNMNAMPQSVGEDEDELDEDIRLPTELMNLRGCNGIEKQDDERPAGNGGNNQVVGSSSGSDNQMSHAQVAQLVEERRKQLLERVLQEQMSGGAAESAGQVPIKLEATSDDEIAVKEEPMDESFEMDPSELLQQAMEEADDQDKELSSSSSSSPSTVIMFRCDYCMKIFHYLDELNAHMALHNGIKGAGGNSALVLGSLDNTAGQVKSMLLPAMEGSDNSTLQQIMLKQLTSRSMPLEPGGDGSTGARQALQEGTAGQLYPVRKLQSIYLRPDTAPTTEQQMPVRRRRNAFEPDPADIVNAPPPEHPCAKCSKMFRTEELRRVHEATHANDALVNKVRSCRICNKVFKCELNLLAHMRKHNSTNDNMLGAATNNEQEGGGDSAGSGHDESCSSTSYLANSGMTNADLESTCNEGETEPGDGGGAASDGEEGSSSSGGGQKSAVRRCEICAISFTDAAMLEKHVLSHFERNEAVAFVPSTDRPFKCTECQKRFKRKDYLLIHIRTHTGERRYKCDLCSSAFVHPSNLITHRKLHSNDRPHKCNICSATFKLFAGLKIHKRRCEQKLPKLTTGSDYEENYFPWSK